MPDMWQGNDDDDDDDDDDYKGELRDLTSLVERSLYTVLAPYRNASPSLVIQPSTTCN